jgi:hypothetical protein
MINRYRENNRVYTEQTTVGGAMENGGKFTRKRFNKYLSKYMHNKPCLNRNYALILKGLHQSKTGRWKFTLMGTMSGPDFHSLSALPDYFSLARII